ncbi:MAG: hypothetical protein QGG09_17795 [Pirellulaceae bacterium]|jgi:hypothetical protein|nr:hypothetical protein [Pirellulaceae bacterium]HJN13426.1 hypothetical protein [Pirellulaceae bacterium]
MQHIYSSLRRNWISVALLTAATTAASGVEPVDPGIGDPYPLSYCIIVPDLPLEEDAEMITVEGREVRMCCNECVDQFLADSYGWSSKIDEMIVKQQLPHYPLTKCIVDGKPLGLGSFNHVFRNRLFRLCGGRCQTKLEQKPAKFFGELDYAVIEKQKSGYPLTTCIVSGKKLGADSLDHVVANQLVRLHSSDQLEQFNRTPGHYLEKVGKATKKKAGSKSE